MLFCVSSVVLRIEANKQEHDYYDDDDEDENGHNNRKGFKRVYEQRYFYYLKTATPHIDSNMCTYIQSSVHTTHARISLTLNYV